MFVNNTGQQVVDRSEPACYEGPGARDLERARKREIAG
jgi:hypothetical protein